MSATIIQLARPPVAKGPLRFTKAAMQAVRAFEYGADLEVHIGACDDGDEHALLLPLDRDAFYPGLNGTCISVDPQGFTVASGNGVTLGVFTDVHEAIGVAQWDITTRMVAYEPEVEVAAWQEFFASLR